MRAAIKTGDRSGALASCDRLLASAAPPVPREQLMLPLLDVIVHCRTLCLDLAAGACIARQATSDAQRTTQLSRGQGSSYPHCDSRKCAQGRAIREAIDPLGAITWRGGGKYGVFERGGRGPDQYRARLRLEALGLLDPVPTCDEPPNNDRG